MSGNATLATAARVLRQLRRDPRTVALMLLVPVALVTLMKWIFNGQPGVFQRVGVPLLGIFPLTSMFLVTAITMLRERLTGTLERLMTMPLAKFDLLAGYGLAFGFMAALQATFVSLVAFQFLGLHVQGQAWAVVALAILNAALGTSLGLFVSAFARTEFQAVQFMPALIMPQVFLSGLMVPRDRMVRPLAIVSDYMPMSYAYDALTRVAQDDISHWLTIDVSILAAVTVLGLALGAATLRRRTA
jgi:ABC-2 type transport system permease protein